MQKPRHTNHTRGSSSRLLGLRGAESAGGRSAAPGMDAAAEGVRRLDSSGGGAESSSGRVGVRSATATAGMDAAAELQRVASLRRDSFGSRSSGPSAWWRATDATFSRSSSRRGEEEEDDEEALRWAAIERLPTCDRVRSAILPLGGDGDGHGHGGGEVVDVLGLGPRDRRALLERLVRVADEDNERFLLKIKERVERCVRAAGVDVDWTHTSRACSYTALG